MWMSATNQAVATTRALRDIVVSGDEAKLDLHDFHFLTPRCEDAARTRRSVTYASLR